MKKLCFYFLFLLNIFPLAAQDSVKTKPATVYLGLAQDNYYGFSAFAFGYYDLTKKTSFSFYTILRQGTVVGPNNTIRPGSAQIGPGLRFNPVPNLFINPVIGVVNGRVLSGANTNVIAEGLAPGCFSTFNGKKIYADQGFLYYKHIRKEGPITSDYIWYWVSLGYNFSHRIRVGAHFEQLYLSHISDGPPESRYQYLAPFIQASFYKNSYVRFTAGHNFTGGQVGNSFIRVLMVFAFKEK